MNTSSPDTTTSSAYLGGNRVGSLSYCIAVSFGITLLIAAISLVSYYCTRNLHPSAYQDPVSWILNIRHVPPDDRHHLALSVDPGLDQVTISGFPKLLYSDVKRLRGMEDSTVTSCCSICLADYKSNDDLRLLPDCGHLFHQKCIDPWLRSHPTCPVCRTSPLPTPLLTPIAAAPLRSS